MWKRIIRYYSILFVIIQLCHIVSLFWRRVLLGYGAGGYLVGLTVLHLLSAGLRAFGVDGSNAYEFWLAGLGAEADLTRPLAAAGCD